jgi:hypothetical protein
MAKAFDLNPMAFSNRIYWHIPLREACRLGPLEVPYCAGSEGRRIHFFILRRLRWGKREDECAKSKQSSSEEL